MKPKISFTIDRSKWGKHTLMDVDGSMCAMGFLGKELGVPNKDLKNKGFPSLNQVKYWGKTGLFKCKDGNALPDLTKQCRISSINDVGPHNKRKEEKLINYFKKIGIGLKFKGKLKHVD